MSRIGNLPIQLPDGVTIELHDDFVLIKGQKGELKTPLFEGIEVVKEEKILYVKCSSKEKDVRAKHGLVRALLHNSVVGTSQGFSRILIMEGVGYRSVKKGNTLVLNLGYSHDIIVDEPEDVKIEVLEPTKIKISGIDKQRVGSVADVIRKFRPPEPFKGKGIIYENEIIRRKAGKSAKK